MGPQGRGTQSSSCQQRVDLRGGRVPSTAGGARESPALTSRSSLPVISCQCPLRTNPTRKAEGTGAHQYTLHYPGRQLMEHSRELCSVVVFSMMLHADILLFSIF